MLVVEIEKPENEPLSIWFSALRDWLDRNHCSPALFVRAGRRLDRLIYRISFDEAVQAQAFCAAFARYQPMVRRAVRFERNAAGASAAAPEPAPAVTANAAD